ncbi:MAG: UDP-N-acetylmuramoyl-L-alanyl-D-glutamate--2,6-diaminopimelate ligase, partial [Clostridiaceae bacterium]|nr:UDP-N-acetylmuramoyl-L-alanyl-D-glutamate--2,6-diaminopimelate ligase [Clostridiaceae bacterium]
MLLRNLIDGLDVEEIRGETDINIGNIAYDSRKAVKDSLFVCIEGTITDGHIYIQEAVENGASAVLIQKEVPVPQGITSVRIKDTRYGLAHVSSRFFDNPSKKLKLVGITGTKGKTTTTFMVKNILEAAGLKVGLIGTVMNLIGNEPVYAGRTTTPESYDLQSLFSDMVEKNTDCAVMEVSSQALKLNRVSCSDFDIGVFTNLYKDHISPLEHKDIDEYLFEKTRLFKMCKEGLVNVDDPNAGRVLKETKCKVYTYGVAQDCDIRAQNIVKHPDSVEFDVESRWAREHVKVGIPGLFSVYNALAAIGVCFLMGIDGKFIREGLERVKVPGRAEVVETNMDFTVMVDYAHTADSLQSILSTVRDFARGRVVCVFGCGGNKDRGRRFGMGEVSGNLADFTIITSDNPRSEDPAQIINDIETGIKKTKGKYIKIEDRREAIKYAI